MGSVILSYWYIQNEKIYGMHNLIYLPIFDMPGHLSTISQI